MTGTIVAKYKKVSLIEFPFDIPQTESLNSVDSDGKCKLSLETITIKISNANIIPIIDKSGDSAIKNNAGASMSKYRIIPAMKSPIDTKKYFKPYFLSIWK